MGGRRANEAKRLRFIRWGARAAREGSAAAEDAATVVSRTGRHAASAFGPGEVQRIYRNLTLHWAPGLYSNRRVKGAAACRDSDREGRKKVNKSERKSITKEIPTTEGERRVRRCTA